VWHSRPRLCVLPCTAGGRLCYTTPDTSRMRGSDTIWNATPATPKSIWRKRVKNPRFGLVDGGDTDLQVGGHIGWRLSADAHAPKCIPSTGLEFRLNRLQHPPRQVGLRLGVRAGCYPRRLGRLGDFGHLPLCRAAAAGARLAMLTSDCSRTLLRVIVAIQPLNCLEIDPGGSRADAA